MKDNFSAQAADYARFRPNYPSEMIEFIISHVPEREMALDVATGNGQVARQLARYFKSVIGTDISEKQLKEAAAAPNIEYKQEQAEHMSFSDGKFDLVVVAQAIHWFDFEKFYSEVARVSKPDGILAVIGYGLFTTNEHTDKIISHFYHEIVGPYWDKERRYLDDNYTTIPFPLEELAVKQFHNQMEWNFDQLVGYLGTWSATEHYKKANGSDPIDLIKKELRLSWDNYGKRVTFPLLLRMGKTTIG